MFPMFFRGKTILIPDRRLERQIRKTLNQCIAGNDALIDYVQSTAHSRQTDLAKVYQQVIRQGLI